jgi:hypothetical protein
MSFGGHILSIAHELEGPLGDPAHGEMVPDDFPDPI